MSARLTPEELDVIRRWSDQGDVVNREISLHYLRGVMSEINFLRACLEPFALKATGWEKRHPWTRNRPRDSQQIEHRLGDFRMARYAVTGRSPLL